jgi:hypothetical protein
LAHLFLFDGCKVTKKIEVKEIIRMMDAADEEIMERIADL